MFKLTRPCNNCPFRKGQGKLFGMHRFRLREIFSAVAFQCHKTVDYSACEELGDEGRPGDKPQQCAGLMSLLHRAGQSNTIMQVGERLGAFDPSRLDHSEVYDSIKACEADHTGETHG